MVRERTNEELSAVLNYSDSCFVCGCRAAANLPNWQSEQFTLMVTDKRFVTLAVLF